MFCKLVAIALGNLKQVCGVQEPLPLMAAPPPPPNPRCHKVLQMDFSYLLSIGLDVVRARQGTG